MARKSNHKGELILKMNFIPRPEKEKQQTEIRIYVLVINFELQNNCFFIRICVNS